ncbi:hypothetical protein GCM10020256_49730 [Streptomyces thermocoprophilus]
MHDDSTGRKGNTTAPSRRSLLAATAGVTAALAVGGTARAAGRDEHRLRALVDRMTLEEKVGQLFVMRVYGHSATAPPTRPTSTPTSRRSACAPPPN